MGKKNLLPCIQKNAADRFGARVRTLSVLFTGVRVFVAIHVNV